MSEAMVSADSELDTDMLVRIADILVVVADVGNGDYSARLTSDLSGDHPVTTLYEGINEMIESLGAAQQRTAAYQKELEEKLATIEVQRAAIRELSTPVIEIWDGVLCLPVFIANAGGVTVSYFEWVQDFSSFFWTEAEINDRLERIMVEALKAVVHTADKHKVSLRTAAFIIACTRVLAARELRGLYP